MTGLRAELHPFRLALRVPLVTGGVLVRFRAGFLVALSEDGITGWGEASPLPGWSRTTLLETEAALRQAFDDLARRVGSPRGGRGGGLSEGGGAVLDSLLAALQGTPHARAGIAGAWADLLARRAGRSLAEHLVSGPAPSPVHSVAVNALIAAAEPSEVEQAVQSAIQAGFGAVKLKVGAVVPDIDVERVRAARSALGAEAELRLDANGAWDEGTALDVLGRVQDCDIAYCEEPVAGMDAVAAVGRRSPVPVAADESIRSEAGAARALDLGISTLVVKPQALGGPDVALSIAARVRQAGASVVVTSFLDSAVGVAHALHVAAAVDAAALAAVDAPAVDAPAPPRRAHGLATAGLLATDVAKARPVVAGTMAVPAAAGLGLAPEPAASSVAPP